LYCANNLLTALDDTQNIALTNLGCSFNQLTSLDVTKNAALTNLICSDNQLTSLDVTQNNALWEFHCFSNQLTSLNVSKNTALNILECSGNQLTCLDVKNGKNFDLLNLVRTTQNPNLTCIEVDDAAWLPANWYIDSQTSLSENCNNHCSPYPVGINESTSAESLIKTLIKTFDIMGRETTFKPNTLLIYLYDDGSTEKVFTME